MLDLAIIGCGAVVADLHVPPLQELARKGAVRVVALVDQQPARAQRIQKRFPGARIFPSFADARNSTPIHLTFVASPPGLHADHGVSALEAGSHVFVEKPMVTRSEDAARLVASAKAACKVLAVAHPRRFFPHVAEVAELVRRGEFGREIRFTYREGGVYGWPIASDFAFRRPVSGGGVLMDTGVHTLDTLEQLFGAGKVVACRDDSLSPGVEANSVVELEFKNAVGTLQLSWDQPLNNGLWIRGNDNEVWLSTGEIRTYRMRSKQGPWRTVSARMDWPGTIGAEAKRVSPFTYYDCVFLQWVGMIRAILHGEPPAVDGVRAEQVISQIESAYSMAEPLELPWLDATEREICRNKHWRMSA
jgi:predicted dehydrogenase